MSFKRSEPNGDYKGNKDWSVVKEADNMTYNVYEDKSDKISSNHELCIDVTVL